MSKNWITCKEQTRYEQGWLDAERRRRKKFGEGWSEAERKAYSEGYLDRIREESI